MYGRTLPPSAPGRYKPGRYNKSDDAASGRAMDRMNSKVEQPGSSASGGDIVKYVLALALVAAGVFAFYWFSDWATVLRGLIVAAGLIAGAVVFLTTAKGA